MYAHVFVARQGEEGWTRFDGFSRIASHDEAARRLAHRGVRLAGDQALASGDVQQLFGIDYERVRGARRYHDGNDPAVQFSIVLVNE